MTTRTAMSMTDMLLELEPAVRAGLVRHLSAATEWFPHEYVPYEEGRNYAGSRGRKRTASSAPWPGWPSR